MPTMLKLRNPDAEGTLEGVGRFKIMTTESYYDNADMQSKCTQLTTTKIYQLSRVK